MAAAGDDIYKRYFNILPTMMGTLDFDGRFDTVNTAWQTQLGFAPSEMAGKPCLDFIHPEDRALMAEHQRKILDGAEQALFECRMSRKGGGYKWLLMRCAADREKKLVYSVATDISARKETEAALKDSQANLQNLLEQAPIAIGIRDKAGDLKFINRKFTEVFGYKAEEIFHFQDWCRLVYPDPSVLESAQARWIASVDAAGRSATGEIPPGEYPITCKDGSVKNINLYGVITAQKDLVGMFEDITRTAKIIKSLRESEATLHDILNNSPLPMGVQTLDGRIEYFNPRFTQTYGYTPQDTPDRQAWMLKTAPDEGYRAELIARFDAAYSKAPAAGGQLETVDCLMTCKNGEVKNVSIAGMIANGKVVAVFEDTTARLRTEQALRESEGTLRKIVDSAPMSMSIVSLNGTIEYINHKAEETFGFPHSEIPTMERWWALAYPDEAYRKEVISRYMGHVYEAMEKGGEISGEEYLVTCKDGSKKTCFIFGVIAAGKVFVMFNDITQRVEAVQALRESENTLRRILDQAPMPMAIHRRDGSIEYLNAKFTQTLGYTLADIPDKETWALKVAPDPGYRAEIMAEWSAAIRAAAETGDDIETQEYRLTCKDGAVKTIRIMGVIAAGKVFAMFDDITLRLQTELALRDSETALRRILEQAPVCIVVNTLDGKLDFANTKFTQTFGYKPEDIPDMDAWARQAYPDEGYRKRTLVIWREWIEKSMHTGLEMEGGEFRVVCKDDSLRTVYITGVVTADKKVVALLEDITARVEAERALRERESLYRALVETTGTGYVVMDGQGKVLDANREYVRLAGHSDLKDIMGRSILEWSAPNNIERASQAVEIVMRDGRLSNFELEYQDKTGKTTTIEINATVVSRNGVRQILGLCRDVSARSKTEAQVRDSESLYRALVETTRTGYVVIGNSGKVKDANREYVRLTGHSDLAEIVGRDVTEWTAPDQKENNAAAVSKCAREGHVFDFETEYIDKKGRRTPIEVNATLVNRDGIPQIHTLCRDITERRQTAAQLQALNQNLERRVQERTAELSAANMELTMEIAQRMDAEKGREKLQNELLQSQKMEVVGRLAGGIAHDFNNILVAISGYAEFLMKTMPDGAPAKDDLNEIVRETERGAMLTRQLSTVARNQPLQLKVISVNTAAEDACKMLKRLIGVNMHLQTKLEPALDNIKCDQGQVAQVIMNLVINARDAMPDGGKIIIETANEEVPASPEGMPLPPPPGQYVTLKVTDTGSGIPAETAAHIFEPFFTTKPEGKGTGLGLSTVYGIVHQVRGGIGLETAPGKGTAFKIYFPRTLERA